MKSVGETPASKIWRHGKRSVRPDRVERLVVNRAACAGSAGFAVGRLQAGAVVMPCAIGAGRIRHTKREGDGATPAGRLLLLQGFFRADRIVRPQTQLPLRALRPQDGWCDDPAAASYNRPVRLPNRCGHEDMWRADGLYDVVIVLDYNMRPRQKGRGSAIFLHCARPDLAPTAGCIALRPADMRRLLPRLGRRVWLTIR
jgi:L,D-peptidoglycan transpeptidase YkuD (ErfK/YbiS/YcfS/YnhG family)